MYISYLFIDLQHVFNVKMIFKYIHLFHVFLFVLLFCSIFSHFGSVHQLTARPVSFAIVVFWTLKKDRVTVTVTVIRNTCMYSTFHLFMYSHLYNRPPPPPTVPFLSHNQIHPAQTPHLPPHVR